MKKKSIIQPGTIGNAMSGSLGSSKGDAMNVLGSLNVGGAQTTKKFIKNNETKEKALRIQWTLQEFSLTRKDIGNYSKKLIDLLSAPRGTLTRHLQSKIDPVESLK